VVALILRCLSVPSHAIINDYVRSEEMYRENPSEKARQVELLKRAGLTVERWIGNPSRVLVHVFQKINARFGSFDGYLDWIGLHQSQRDQLALSLQDSPRFI